MKSFKRGFVRYLIIAIVGFIIVSGLVHFFQIKHTAQSFKTYTGEKYEFQYPSNFLVQIIGENDNKFVLIDATESGSATIELSSSFATLNDVENYHRPRTEASNNPQYEKPTYKRNKIHGISVLEVENKEFLDVYLERNNEEVYAFRISKKNNQGSITASDLQEWRNILSSFTFTSTSSKS